MRSVWLGKRVRDTISGFEGIATGHCLYMQGCDQVGITPTELKDGKPIPSMYFDDKQVVIVKQEPKETRWFWDRPTPIRDTTSGQVRPLLQKLAPS